MKLYRTILIISLFLSTGITTAQDNKTIIKGKVHYWPTDTIYLQTMPFHSPHSSELKFQTISKDSTFNFEFKNSDKPFVVQLFFNKKNAKLNREQLLFLNLTEKYYFSHCSKFYTYGVTTFLIEPNKVTNINLERNWSISTLTRKQAEKYRKSGIPILEDNSIQTTQKTSIEFLESNTFQNNYYQKSFDLTEKIDNRLDIYKTKSIDKAIISYKKVKLKLLNAHELEKDKLSPVFYDYIKAEIEFGARVEFLKFLMLSKEKEMDDFFANEIPKDIMNIIEFDKTKVNHTTLISEAYNKYLELYLSFKINIQNKKLNVNHKFSIQKIRTAIKNLPHESVYYYLANHLLQTNREQLIQDIKNEEAVEELITKTITKYPNGELNDKLIEKYDL